MTRKLKPARHAAKSARFRKRKLNCTTGNPISYLMQVVKNLLPARKPAWHLHILTGAGLSTCQKVLSGHRAENGDLILALLRSPHGWDVLQAVMAEADQPWFEDLRDLVDINQLKRDALRMKRDLDRREQRLLETKAGVRS
jgi:hypothetical protein